MARPGRGHRRLRRAHPPDRAPRRSSTATAPSCIERAGDVLAPCGNRRAAVCPACSDRYAADAFHLLRAGLAGDDTKGVPDDRDRARRGCSSPSPRRRSGRCTPARSPAAGTSSPAGCGDRHHPDDPRIGTAARPRHLRLRRVRCSGRPTPAQLWHRFTIALRRALAAALGVRGPRLPRPRPAVLRQGRRVPAPRPGPLPRRHPPRRPRRTRRPAPGRARPTTRSATPSPRAARAATLTASRPGRDTAGARAGAPSSTSAPITPTARRAGRGRARARSPTPRWPATSPSTPPRAPAPPTGADRPIRDGDPHRPPRRHPAPPPHDRNRLAARRPRRSTRR